MCLAGAGATDKDDVAAFVDEVAGIECPELLLVERQLIELEAIKILGYREAGLGHAIADRTGLSFTELNLKELLDNGLGGLAALACTDKLTNSAAGT